MGFVPAMESSASGLGLFPAKYDRDFCRAFKKKKKQRCGQMENDLGIMQCPLTGYGFICLRKLPVPPGGSDSKGFGGLGGVAAGGFGGGGGEGGGAELDKQIADWSLYHEAWDSGWFLSYVLPSMRPSAFTVSHSSTAR
jgi:hypothetical protein